MRESLKCTVPGGNLRTWLLENWPTRNLVIHGSVGQKIDFSEPSSIPFIGDADDLAVMLAAEPGENTISSWESIDVQDLVPLTEEAQQVKSYLMQVHMMVLHNGVGASLSGIRPAPRRAGVNPNEPLPAGRMTGGRRLLTPHKISDSWLSVARAIPLLMQTMDNLSKGKPVSST